jgi:hypothetical protein
MLGGNKPFRNKLVGDIYRSIVRSGRDVKFLFRLALDFSKYKISAFITGQIFSAVEYPIH